MITSLDREGGGNEKSLRSYFYFGSLSATTCVSGSVQISSSERARQLWLGGAIDFKSALRPRWIQVY